MARPPSACLIALPQLSNLAFLKTHKTGSTTLSSLFYRYGVRHGLKVRRTITAAPVAQEHWNLPSDRMPVKMYVFFLRWLEGKWTFQTQHADMLHSRPRCSRVSGFTNLSRMANRLVECSPPVSSVHALFSGYISCHDFFSTISLPS